MQLDINVPQLVTADDYHEFGSMQHLLQLLNKKLKVEEIGFDNSSGEYVAVIYIGRRPARVQLKKLAEDQGRSFEELS